MIYTGALRKCFVLICFLFLSIILPYKIASAVKNNYGVMAGGNINARDIIIKKGLTEKEVLAIFREIQKKHDPAVKELIKLSEKLGVTKATLQNFFLMLGKNNIPEEKLLESLVEIAESHKQLQEQVRALTSGNKEIGDLRDKALKAIDQGDYPLAEQLLVKAENLQIEFTEKKKEEAVKEILKTAEIRAARGKNCMLQYRYLEAAEHYQKAYEIVPEAYIKVRLEYLTESAGALKINGAMFGNNLSLKLAIEKFKNVLKIINREKNSLYWAKTQNNLGNTLRILGERESGTKLLEEAVTAFRDALKEYTRERVPLDWAVTQNNLGIVIGILGGRESGTKLLEESVSAFREALKEYTRERVPLGWAGIQNNLGNALRILGELDSGTKLLEESVSAYREALKEITRERVPLDWAVTQNNLGNTLQALGKRERGTKLLEESVSAYREALKERTRERVPLDWAMTQSNLGNALQFLGLHESGTKLLEEAVTAYREALKERTREKVPLDWAGTQNNLGTALQTLGARESRTKLLEEAVEAYREALKERTRERVPLDWAGTQNNLGSALYFLGTRKKDIEVLKQAQGAIKESYDIYKSEGYSHYYGSCEKRLKGINSLIETLTKESKNDPRTH